MQKIFDIQWFDWWEGDDIYRLPSNWFYAGENIEIRKDLSWIQLSALLEDTWWNFDWNITCIVALDTLWVSGWGIVVCTDTGKIYLNGTLKKTLASSYKDVLNIWVNISSWVQYVYYVTKNSFGTGKIHRSTTNINTWVEDHREYTVATGNTGYAWIINNTWLLYIAIQNKVFILDEDEILYDYFIIPDKEWIKFISQFQDTFKVYANNVNTGIQYIWDGASTNPTYRQEWYNQPILWWVNDWSYDYVILGFNENYSDLYQVAGTQKQEIRSNLETSTLSRVLNWFLSIRQWIVYISWWKSWESSNYGIYTYGNYYPWARKSLVQSHSWTSNAFLWHCHSETNSYFACADDKVYKVSHNNPPTSYATNWYIESWVYQGDVWSEMNFDKVRIGYKLNGGTIIVKVRTGFWNTWKTIKTITDGSAKLITTNEVNTALWTWLGNFYEFQVRLELTSWTWTPIVRRCTTWLNTTDKI